MTTTSRFHIGTQSDIPSCGSVRMYKVTLLLKALTALCFLLLTVPASAQTLQLFVADFDNDRVDTYNAATSILTPFVTAGSGGLVDPFGIVFAPNGDLLVGDPGSSTIRRYSGTNGAYLGNLVSAGSGGLGNPYGPYGMLIASDGNLLVANADGSVKKYSTVTGNYLGNFVAAGSGGLTHPHGLAYGPDGSLYVSDFNDNTVKRYNGTTGAFINTFVTSGSGGIVTPTGLSFGPTGDLYVASTDTNQIKRYNGLTGAFIGNFTSANRPWGVEFSSAGDLYIGTSGGTAAAFSVNGITGNSENVYGAGRGGTYLALRTTAASAPEPGTFWLLVIAGVPFLMAIRRYKSVASVIKVSMIVSTLLLSAAAHAQNLIINGGFDTTGFNGPATTSTQSNSSFVGVSAAANWAVWNFGGFVPGVANTVSTAQISPSTLAGGGNDMIRVTTTNGVGNIYQNNLNSLGGPARATLSLFVVSGSVLADLSINGGPSDGSIFTAQTGVWQTFSFTSTMPIDQIRIFSQSYNTQFYVDNVSVVPTSAAAPEPIPLGLLVMGVPLAVLASRHRKQ